MLEEAGVARPSRSSRSLLPHTIWAPLLDLQDKRSRHPISPRAGIPKGEEQAGQGAEEAGADRGSLSGNVAASLWKASQIARSLSARSLNPKP